MTVFDLAEHDSPHVYSLPPGRPFFDDLVQALIATVGEDLDRLADMRIFLPSRRAVRTLKEAFLRRAPSGVALLPRITAVADLDEDDLLSDGLVRVAAPLPPAASSTSKRLRLAVCYRERMRTIHGATPPLHAALDAATLLSQASDQMIEYGVGTEALDQLRESELMAGMAGHWQSAIKILEVASSDWPEWLETERLLDTRDRRARLLEDISDRIAGDVRAELVLAAGFLGTSPSSRRFLRTIASMPKGAVVLPAFDHLLTDEAWAEIDAPHPQSAYRDLLADCFEIGRLQVVQIPHTDDQASRKRRELLSLALMPTESTDSWAEAVAALRADEKAHHALDGLGVAVARTMDEEADLIALAMRETLETPGATASLVTADRNLGRRVAGKLAGWGIEVDDSGGMPLAGSYRATFMRLIARVMAKPNDPGALAGLIHHQLFGLGMPASERRPLVQALDIVLRGRDLRDGWDGLAACLDDDWRPHCRLLNAEAAKKARALISELSEVFRDACIETGPVRSLLECHIKIAEKLAATDTEDGAERLFRFEDGEVLEPHLRQLLDETDILGDVEVEDYTEVFDSLLKGPVVRPPGGQHPRLSILGVLEGRLQSADLLIVGGLQEGVWPGDAAVDPFFSRAMRKELGMPLPEAEIGRVAHDFQDLAAAPKVLLTRSERQGPSPARPSRFMVRLESFLQLLGGEGRSFDWAPRLRALRDLRFRHEGPVAPASRPAPTIPGSRKPLKLTVSAIGTWIRDPYAIYAEHALRLKKLPSYDENFGPRDRGDIVHKLLELFVERYPDELPASVEDALLSQVDEVIHRYAMPERQRLLGRRFLRDSIAHAARFETTARSLGRPLATECKGKLVLPISDRQIEIRGRADRIDYLREGLHIIDYKLGGSASLAEDGNFSPQLFLLALMARQGGFDAVDGRSVEQIAFLRLNQDDQILTSEKDKTSRHLRGLDLMSELDAFEKRLTAFLTEQYQDDCPMPSQVHPFSRLSSGNYDDLARRGEWGRGQGDE